MFFLKIYGNSFWIVLKNYITLQSFLKNKKIVHDFGKRFLKLKHFS